MGKGLDCDGWEVEAKDPPMRWDGRLGDRDGPDPDPIDTAFPLLFLSGRRDPVTPLRAAVKMARKFAGAGLVEQASDGHCTIACASPCTARHLRAYLNDGVVPPPPRLDGEYEDEDGNKRKWTTCECAETPWGYVNGAASQKEGEESTAAVEDLKIMASYRELRGHFMAQTMSEMIDRLNPLREFIVDSAAQPLREQQTCSQRGLR